MTCIAALIRHGDYHQLAGAPSAHQPFPLNPRGETQARAAVAGIGEALAGFGCALCPVLDCSTLLRAWQTARIIADGLAQLAPAPLSLRQSDALTERCVGSAANLTEAQIEAIVRDDPRHPELPAGWKSASDFRLPFPGAESLLQAGARVAGHLEAAMAALQADGQANVLKLFVGHGGSFRHAALHLGILAAEDIPRLSMHHATPVYLERGAGGKWRQVGGEWKVRGRGEAYRD